MLNYEQEIKELARKQQAADRAWAFLVSKSVNNLDIERSGKEKVTLVELLCAYEKEFMDGREIPNSTRSV